MSKYFAMKNKKSISVIMSVYNEPIEWLDEAINSVLRQTFTDFEFIVVNDNPERDGLKEILYKYQQLDPRIIIIENDSNVGLTRSLNKGLDIAIGKYIARMDADDISSLDRFEKQFLFMEQHPDVIVCGTDITYIGDKGHFVYSDWIKYNDIDIRAQMLFNSGFAHPTVFIRNSSLNENRVRYDVIYRQAQDYRLWEQLWDLGRFANLKEKLYYYRISSQQISSQSSDKQFANGRLIRRRLLAKWLVSLGMVAEIPTFSKCSEILEYRKCVKKAIINTDSKKNFISFSRLLYFSYTRCFPTLFIYAIFCGDLFSFSIKDQMRFFLITIHLKQPVKW